LRQLSQNARLRLESNVENKPDNSFVNRAYEKFTHFFSFLGMVARLHNPHIWRVKREKWENTVAPAECDKSVLSTLDKYPTSGASRWSCWRFASDAARNDLFSRLVSSGIRGRCGQAGQIAKFNRGVASLGDNWGPFVAIGWRLDRLPRTGVFVSIEMIRSYGGSSRTAAAERLHAYCAVAL
jgi:hypothetical protein